MINEVFKTFYNLGLQSIPGDSQVKDAVAMLVGQTKEANEKYFCIVLQHGSRDVTEGDTNDTKEIIAYRYLW